MSSLAERTYTFRAAGDLGARIQEASVILNESADAANSDLAEKIAAALVLALARDSERFRAIRGNQSAFVRQTVELLLSATEKVASDLRYAGAYAEAVESRTDDEVEFRRASNGHTAQRWHGA